MSTTVSHGRADLARSRRRGTVVLALIVVLLGLAGVFTATGQSADPPQVTFVTPEGQSYVLPLSGVEPDIVDRSYTVRNPKGTKTPQPIAAGYSIEALSIAVSKLPGSISIDPYAFLQIERPDFDPVLLRRGQVTSDRAFPDGPPVVWADENGVHFLRPQTDAKDDNSLDTATEPSNLTIRLLETVPFKISVKVTPKHPKVGETVHFSGNVTAGKASGETLIYTWSSGTVFNDKAQSTTYAFTKAGTWKMQLRVSSDFNTGGISKVVSVPVGKPVESEKDRTGGGTNDDEDAPDTGASEGSSGAGGDTSGDTPPADDGTYDDGYDPGTSAVTPAPVTPAPTPATTAEPPKTTPKPPPAQTTPTTAVPTAPGESTVQGTVISGLSLAAASVPPAAAAPPKTPDASADKTVAARTGTPKDPADPNGGLHIPAGVWILLLLVLLLVGGFWQDAYRAVAPRSVPRIP